MPRENTSEKRSKTSRIHLGWDSTQTLNNKPSANSGHSKKQNKSLQVVPEKDQKANGRPISQSLKQ